MNYNPILDYQRNQLLAQQSLIQNQLNQLNPQRQAFNPYPQPNDPFVIRQVGSIEEVKAYPVEPGMMYLFPDTGSGNIYFKRLNTDNGKSEIIIYKPCPETSGTTPEHTSKESDITTKLDSIEKKIGDVYESISGIKVYAESDRHNAAADVTENAITEPAKVSADTANVKWEV